MTMIQRMAVCICLVAAFTPQTEPAAAANGTIEKEIIIRPGNWRGDNYPWEHVAGISFPWSGAGRILMDFPEAIFTKSGLLFLSHVNPDFPVVFPDPPGKIKWQADGREIHYERTLPNGVKFGGSVRPSAPNVAGMNLYIVNNSKGPLEDILLQTCSYFGNAGEFSDRSLKRYVHTKAGWKTFNGALESKGSGRFFLGWRGGVKKADLPVMVTVNNKNDKLIAMTWYDDTYSLIHSTGNPCMHADPKFPDLRPGQKAEINGELIFFEGSLEDFYPYFIKRYRHFK